MSEKIIQGDEDPTVAATRKADWLARPPIRPEDMPTTLADLILTLMTPGVTLPLTDADIIAAKRNRP